ncbi:MAG: pirin family protein [Micrococcales bacterium]|nr:pirin family protein [Micrococcales bacterium]
MSNLEQRPQEQPCAGHPHGQPSPEPRLLEPREVPLGGPRAMTVRRTVPHKEIRTVGAWCFVDHYGPERIRMAVPPHPHVGLQTVSWLLSGYVEHRDSLGSLQRVRPGELNLMTAGHGIAHSEYSVGEGVLHGVQLWVALTDEHRAGTPAFEHHGDLPVVHEPGMRATVVVGEFAGAASPATVHSPLVAAELVVSAAVTVPLRPDFEYAVLALDTDISADGARVPHGALQYLGWGATELRLAAPAATRVLVLGGEPLAEDLLMWWNFVGRTHAEIVAAREQWQAGDPRFGEVPGDPNPRLPAPALPTVALKPRPSRR